MTDLVKTVLCCLACLMQAPVLAQNSRHFYAADRYVRATLDTLYKNDSTAAVCIGVMKNGATKFYTLGYADTLEHRFDSTTLFETGSISKTFTAYILTAVLTANKIDDNAGIYSYLPDSLKTNKSLTKITFRKLLNHTSGLPKMPSNFEDKITDTLQPYEHYTYSDLFSFLKHDTIKYSDTGFEYSNMGYALCGYLATQIARRPYLQLLHEYILKYLDPKNTQAARIKGIGYFNSQTPAEWWDIGIFYPAGGIILNTQQLLEYMGMMSKPVVLSRPIVEKVTTKTRNVGKDINICLGWHTYNGASKTIYWHNGGTYGYSTFCAFTKGTGDGVVVVVNKFDTNSVADKLGSTIIKLLTNN